MTKSTGSSTPVPRSSAAKQWLEQLAKKKKVIEISTLFFEVTSLKIGFDSHVG